MEENTAPTPETKTQENTAPTPENVKLINHGFDPKNRVVQHFIKGNKHIVTKNATGFFFEGSEKTAKKYFKHQVNCSQNQ